MVPHDEMDTFKIAGRISGLITHGKKDKKEDINIPKFDKLKGGTQKALKNALEKFGYDDDPKEAMKKFYPTVIDWIVKDRSLSFETPHITDEDIRNFAESIAPAVKYKTKKYGSSNPDICVYVDLDNTLVYSQNDMGKFGTENISSMNRKKVSVGGKTFHTVLRPGAKELLYSLNLLGRVSLCTLANRSYADAVLSAFGLNHYFSDGVISREDLGKASSEFSKAVLIDNLPSTSDGIKLKLETIGFGYDPLNFQDSFNYETEGYDEEKNHLAKYHVRVKPFLGDSSDRDLFSTISKVVSALNSQ